MRVVVHPGLKLHRKISLADSWSLHDIKQVSSSLAPTSITTVPTPLPTGNLCEFISESVCLTAAINSLDLLGLQRSGLANVARLDVFHLHADGRLLGADRLVRLPVINSQHTVLLIHVGSRVIYH